jgi:hypothetical protein
MIRQASTSTLNPLPPPPPQVVAALCDVYQRTLLSTKAAAKPLLPDFINSLVAIFCAQLQPCCLEPLATVVEVFGEVRSAPEVRAGAAGGAGWHCSVLLVLVQCYGRVQQYVFACLQLLM